MQTGTAFAMLPSFTICQISSKAKMSLKHNRRFSFVIDAMIGKYTLFWSPFWRGLMHDPGTLLNILCTMYRLIWIRQPRHLFSMSLASRHPLSHLTRSKLQAIILIRLPRTVWSLIIFYRCKSCDLSIDFQLHSIYINGQTDQPEGYLTD